MWGAYDSEAEPAERDRGFCSRLTCDLYRRVGEGCSRREQPAVRVVAAVVALLLGGLRSRVMPPAAVAEVAQISERGAAETMRRLQRAGWIDITGDRRACWTVALGARWAQECNDGASTWSRRLRIGAIRDAAAAGATLGRIDALVLHCLEAGGRESHSVSLEALARSYNLDRAVLSKATGWLRGRGLLSYGGSRRVFCSSQVWTSVKTYCPLKKRGASHARENPTDPITFSSYRQPQTRTTNAQSEPRPTPVQKRRRLRGPPCLSKGCGVETRPKPPRGGDVGVSFDVWCGPCWSQIKHSRRVRRGRQLVMRGLRTVQWARWEDLADAYGAVGVVAMDTAIEDALARWSGVERDAAGLQAHRQGDAVAALRGRRHPRMGSAGASRAAVEEIAAADALCTQIGRIAGGRSDVAASETYRAESEAATLSVQGLAGAAESARELLYARPEDPVTTPPPRREPQPPAVDPAGEQAAQPQETGATPHEGREVQVEGLLSAKELAERMRELKEQLRSRRLQVD